jgi:hypothetical protein
MQTYRKVWYKVQGRTMYSIVCGELSNAQRVANMNRQRGFPTLIDVTSYKAKSCA